MLIEPFLSWLVVVGSDGQNTRDTDSFQLCNQLNGVCCVIPTRSRQDWKATTSFLHRNLGDPNMLIMSERGTFTGGAARHKEIDACVNLAGDKSAQHAFVK